MGLVRGDVGNDYSKKYFFRIVILNIGGSLKPTFSMPFSQRDDSNYGLKKISRRLVLIMILTIS